MDDGYLGSGKLIKRAIKKYGIENFTKEILHVFDNEEEMNQKEKELVVIGESSYNLCEGGKGGFGYLNSGEGKYLNKRFDPDWQKKNSPFGDPEFYRKHKEVFRRSGLQSKGRKMPVDVVDRVSKINRGKKRSFEFCLLRSTQQQGERNSQYGTMWITNGIVSKTIKKIDIIPEGWRKGRVIKT